MSDRKPRIAVAIPTHNRSAYLKKALDSLVAQEFDPTEREIIVVLNVCTDDSRTMIDTHFRGLAGLTLVDEPEAGLGPARNRALQTARSPVIAFLDDDAIAPPTWLASIAASLGPDRPDVAAAGGPVRPLWEAPRPSWLPASLEIFLTIVDHGPEEKALGPYNYIVGANMAYRTELLRAIGGFAPQLDRVRGKLLSNGDLLPQDQLRAQGYKVLYNPAAPVDHHVSADRLEPKWFLERGYWQGYSDCVMALHLGRHKTLARTRRVCRSVVELLRYPAAIASLIGQPDPARLESQFKGQWLLGYFSASVSDSEPQVRPIVFGDDRKH